MYGVTSTAIMFSAAMLKETCVAFFLMWWVVGAIAIYRSGRTSAWFAFGVYCGLGAALRSTLFLLCLAALALPALRLQRGRQWRLPSALLAAGVLLALAPWSVRNFRALGSFSPFPHNGGIVLHQVYNPDNPRSAIWVPPFVNYSHPSEIWRGYAAEADRRTGRTLSPAEVDAYWQEQALAFMREHPHEVLYDIAKKNLIFLADSEVPNNRSAQEERLFSPVLALLPRPMAFLLGMGLTGLVWFGVRDRRWPLLAAPIALSVFTFAVFWAEDRFRFHAAAVLALCSGLWLDGMIAALGILRARRRLQSWQPLLAGLVALSISSLSWSLGSRFPPPPVHWDHVIWGYVKMGRLQEAHAYADKAIATDPDDGPVLEALGFLAANDHRYPEAVKDFERAIEVRPRSYVAHFNLARALLETGDRTRAAAEARTALELNPSPDTRALVEQLGPAP
jgi:tetratricopeptide (TPR) repeat protein